MALDRRKLRTRAISAIVGAVILALATLVLPKWFLHGLVFIAGTIALVECRKMARGFRLNFFLIPGIAALIIGLASIWSDSISLSWIPYVVMLISTFIALMPSMDVGRVFPSVGATFAGTAYVALAVLPISILFESGVESTRGRILIALYGIIVWSNDIAAYLIGSLFGKRKIAPRISPNKTYAGTVGGILTATTLGVLCAAWMLPGLMPHWQAACISFTLALLGFLGDLLESSWKRGSHLKDSGKLIPGHGGVLDRLDAMFLSAPAFLAFVQYILPSA